jgi:hypothetical protein
MHFDQNTRYALIKIKDAVEEFVRNYLRIVMGRVGIVPIGPLSTSKQQVIEHAERATRGMQVRSYL